MTDLLDGRLAAAAWREELQATLAENPGLQPRLDVLLVGHHPASQTYVEQKRRAAAQVGITVHLHTLPATVSREEILSLLTTLNHTPAVHGILIQLPLPDHLHADTILAHVSPEKDVDGFHPYNLGRLVTGKPSLVACTPLGIDRLLKHYHISLAHKEVVIVGRSRIVGKPLALLWNCRSPMGDPTVTLAHSQTQDLTTVCRRADLLVVAAGQPGLIGAAHVRPGAVVIDVGIHRISQGGQTHLCGDVAWEEIQGIAAAATPVPGGVGPMTVAALLANTVELAKKLTQN